MCLKSKRILGKTLSLVLLLCMVPLVPARAQIDPVDALLARLTTQEKVGQLFIVAFWGRTISPQRWVGKLIQEYKVGNVVLITSNSNLSNRELDTPRAVAELCDALQALALDEAGPGVPLFIAIDHEGDGFPYTRITNGVTPLPNPMAIGATWNPRYAEQVGEIVGRELAAMGINMLLGPVIDVLDDPRPGSRGDVGSRVFGGDPYWVGEMGRAYIRGVHLGGEGRVLTVAKHFPGHGGSDRLPDDEVATVDKSLQELKRVELAPFFAVTNPLDPGGLDRTDALMSSHIRYRGFYGDIRRFTRPISFDAESMQALLALDEFQAWRQQGIMISDSLGVQAVRKYFDPQLRTFPHRQIAREAFLAGNDLLMLSEFALSFNLLQHYANVVEVLDYFAETYEREPAFAARVDEAVRRILYLKLKLYPDISIESVLDKPVPLSDVGQGGVVVQEIARRAATVLEPSADRLPRPPHRDEDVLILAEERLVYECYDDFPECEPYSIVPVTATQEAILRLYGPQGTMQVDPARIHTRTFAELKAFLTLPRNGQPEATVEPPPDEVDRPEGSDLPGRQEEEQKSLDALLNEAEWIVFAMLEPTPWYPDSDALQLFLAQDAQRIYDANVVVLAYTIPYYLDVTEISKLTAYYVFYSKTLPFIEASVRTLFGEVRPQGRSPVSIEGTYYDLGTQLSPDPSQQIELRLLEPDVPASLVPVTLRLRTGLILDRNGNLVPDGTLVRFTARDGDVAQIVAAVEGVTVGGAAEAALKIDRPARLLVSARSGDTPDGPVLAFQALPQPTSTPTSTPTPTPTPTSTPTQTPRPTATVTPTPAAMPSPTPTVSASSTVAARAGSVPFAAMLAVWQGQAVDLWGLLLGTMFAAAVSYLWRGRRIKPPRLVRLLLLVWVGGLVGYLVYGFLWSSQGQWLNWLTATTLAFAGAMLFTTFGFARS
jgi:beta-N-acetylhexosaminidase